MCMLTRKTRLFHKVIVLQIIKSLPPIIWRDHPWTSFVLLDSSAGPVPSSPKAKTPYCNNMKNVASFYYKFLRTHHARGVSYHFDTGIPSVSKMQCTTQRVYSNRDLFKTLTSMNIARDHHNRIIHRFIELWRQSTSFICMFTRMTRLFHKVIVLQILKASLP